MEFHGVDDLAVSGNSVAMTSGTVASVDGSCDVSVSGKSYPGGSPEVSITNPACLALAGEPSRGAQPVKKGPGL